MKCPCGSGRAFTDCCEPFIDGIIPPPGPEQLMRSRYSAFALQRMAYIAASWHPDFRPPNGGDDATPRWIGLSVLEVRPGIAEAQVEFEARYLAHGEVQSIHERSEFRFEQGRWWYTTGTQLPPTFTRWKPARNEPCPCGSGIKFKRCCGSGRAVARG